MTDRQRAVAYYGIATFTLAFGLIGIASIGYPFLFVGLVLFAVGPVRRRRDVLWPPLVAIAVATASYVALGPTRCSPERGGGYRCENLLGFELFGESFTALVIGVSLGLAVGVTLHLRITKGARDDEEPGERALS